MSDWSQDEQARLDAALQAIPRVEGQDAKERWKRISEAVGRPVRDCAERYKILRAQFTEAKAKAEALTKESSKEKGANSNDLLSSVAVFGDSNGATAIKMADEVEATETVRAKQEAVECPTVETSAAQDTKNDGARIVSATTTFKMQILKPTAPVPKNTLVAPTSDPKPEMDSEQQKRDWELARAALSATSEEEPQVKKPASKEGAKKKSSNGAAEVESSQSSTSTNAAKLKVCRFFASAGACKAGAACKYAHVSLSPNDAAAAAAAAPNAGGGSSSAAAQGAFDAAHSNGGKSTSTNTPGKASKKSRPCRNGAACKIPKCLFDHPPNTKGAQPVVKKVLQRGTKDESADAASGSESVANTSAGGSTGKIEATAASSSLFCEACNLQCTSTVVYEDHCKGKKHAAAMKRIAASNSSSSGSVGAAPGGGGEAKADLKGNKKKTKVKPKVNGWWRSVEDIDPISLEPISELDYPPFELAREASATESAAEGRGNLFDGRLLALYFVASSVFEDPMNRREVTAGECTELDAYLRRHNLGKGNVASARALEMERRATAAENAALADRATGASGQSSNQARAGVLQREAQGLLLSMFGIVVNNDNNNGGSSSSQTRSGPQRVNRQQQRTEGSLGTGLVLHDDDVGGSLSSSSSSSSTSESFAARSAANPSASGAFPALAPPSAKIEKVAWVKSSKPSPVFAPSGPASARGGGLGGNNRQVAESGIAQRNMRLQLALGLNSGGGAAAAAAAAVAADSSVIGAQQQQQSAEQFATVWPTELRKWAQNERGEVIKLERKVAELLADPRGTSTTIKAMPRAMRRLTYMWAEFYAMNGRSDDDGDARGKSMSLIKTRLSSAPYPLLSDADRFEFQHPGLMSAARDEQARAQAAKQTRKDEEASSAKAAAEACWVLLCNVPDAIELPLLKKLVASASKEPIHSIWENTPPKASPDEGLDYVASFLNAAAAARACANLRGNPNLPFSAKQSSLVQGLLEQTKVTRRETSNDSWRDDSGSSRGGVSGGGGSGADSESWRVEAPAAVPEAEMESIKEEVDNKDVTTLSTAASSVISAGEEVESWEDLADLATDKSEEAHPKSAEEAEKDRVADEGTNGESLR